MKKYAITIFLVIFSLLLGIFLTYHFMNKKIEREVIYFTDSLNEYKLKNGDIAKQYQLLEHEKDVLEKKFSDIMKEKSNLPNKPLVITRVVTDVKLDTIFVPISNDNSYEYSEVIDSLNYVLLKGRIVDTLNVVDELKIRSSLFYNIVEDDKGYLSVVTRSPNPYLEVQKVEGSMFDIAGSKYIKRVTKKDKRFHVGFQFGYGVAFTPMPILSPSVSVGVTYSMFSF